MKIKHINPDININDLKQKILKHDVISFDIFDTLVLRPFFYPEDLFLYIEKKYQIQNFYSNRLKASNIAYSNIEFGEDTTLNNIYQIFSELIKDSNKSEYLKEIEIKEEILMSGKNSKIYELYEYALNNNKKIIFTSDMYLPESVIRDILLKNGYSKYDKLYISSMYSKLKKTGNLFKLIINDLKIKPHTMIHIGDNMQSDYLVPKELGIHACHCPRYQEIYKNSNFCKIDNNCKDPILSNYYFNCALNYNKYKNKSYWHRFGYEIAGPICVNYVKWIIEQTNKICSNDIIFIARDGFLLEKICNKLTKNSKKTYYLYAPRSLNLLCQLNYEKDGDFTYEHTKTIIDYYRSKSKKIKLLPEILTKQDGVKYLEENYNELKTLAETEYDNFVKYINSHLQKADNITIVDSVSKFFSAQRFIEKCVNKDLCGLYYLIQEGADLSDIIVESYSPISKYSAKDYLIEFIMTSNEPPILSVSGKQVLYKSMTKNEYTRIEAFNEISQGILDFTEDLVNTECNCYINKIASIDSINDFIYLFINNPTETDKEKFKKVLFAYDAKHSDYRPLYPKWYENNNPLCKKTKAIENIFSIKNSYRDNIKHKVITLFGIKIKIKVKTHNRYNIYRTKILGILPLMKKLKNDVITKYYLFDCIPIFKKEKIKYEL